MTGKTKWKTTEWKKPKFKDALPPAERKPPKRYSSPIYLKSEIGRRWYVVSVNGGGEFKASAHFRQLGWRVFVPWYSKAKRNGGGRVMGTDLPWITGYLFVWAERYTQDGNPLSEHDLKSHIYSNGLLGCGDEPTLIKDDDKGMKELLSRADVDGYVKDAVAPLVAYVVGDSVVIEDEIWGDIPGKVTRVGAAKTVVYGSAGGKSPAFHKVSHDRIRKATA